MTSTVTGRLYLALASVFHNTLIYHLSVQRCTLGAAIKPPIIMSTAGLLPFYCSQCGTSFRRSEHFERHLLSRMSRRQVK